jgi:hypothetical protein
MSDCTCRPHAERLTRKAAFTEKIALPQYANGCLLAIAGYYGEFDLASLDIKHCVGGIALREDYLLLAKMQGSSALANSREEGVRVETMSLLSHLSGKIKVSRKTRCSHN